MEFKWLIAQLIYKENKIPEYHIFKISMFDCFNTYCAFSQATTGQIHLNSTNSVALNSSFCDFDDFPDKL